MSNRDPLHFISLGAGVQSSTMAMLAAKGIITPMPLGAVFADTQGEPAAVYAWLDWLEKQLPFPVYRPSRGSLEEREMSLKTVKKPSAKYPGKVYRENKIPSFFWNKEAGKAGRLMRKCTADYKITVIHKEYKALLRQMSVKPAGKIKIIQWIGFSTDEMRRVKPSKNKWIENRFPLLELNLSRTDCLKKWEEWGLPKPPRSACYFCPQHSDTEWIRLKNEEPEEFKKACIFEKNMQKADEKNEIFRRRTYLHSSCVPLEFVQFIPKNKSEPLLNFEQGLDTQCDEGYCGV
jgi:hypothetical protein